MCASLSVYVSLRGVCVPVCMCLCVFGLVPELSGKKGKDSRAPDERAPGVNTLEHG